VKWRFYDGGEDGLSVSVFPQAFLNNPNDAVTRGITAPNNSFLLPIEFSKKFGPVDVNWELGYQFVYNGPDGWLAGLVVGHEFTKKLELDVELYSTGTFRPSESQPQLISAAATNFTGRSFRYSWRGAAWNMRCSTNLNSLATSGSNYCFRRSLTRLNRVSEQG
jgi:hypothetical protein